MESDTVTEPDQPTAVDPPLHRFTQSESWRSEVLVTLGVALVAMIATVVVMQLWSAHLRTPLDYGGDALSHQMIVQSLLDSDWVFGTPRLGAPFGQSLLDFPTTDHLQYLYYAAISVAVGGDVALGINLGFVGMFGIIAAITFAAFRQVGLRRTLAAAGAVLYALLPYHFVRATSHLFLGGYLAVPLVALVLVWQMGGRPLFRTAGVDGGLRWTWRDPRGYVAIAAMMVAAFTGTYYAVFGGLLLAVVAILTFAAERDWRRFAGTTVLLGVLGASLLITMLPTLIHTAQEGANPAALVRSYSDVELYALRPVQLVLPIPMHRIPELRQFMTTVSVSGGELGQNLGIVGSMGLVLSFGAMGVAVFSRREGPRFNLISRLGLLNMLAILLGTVAGAGALLGLFGLDEVRAWNRIVVYVAFFSLAAAMLVVQRWTASLTTLAVGAIAAVILIVGVLDQTRAPNADAYAASADAYWNDSEFFEPLEASMPEGAAVFQLPYVPFPENPPVVDMTDYSHVRGYLHTDDLRWSYGGMKGRPESEWQRDLVASPVGDLLVGVVAAGFEGLYIDRFGYADRGAALESEISKRLSGTQPLVSRDGRMVFYDLRPFRTALVAARGEPYLQEIAADVLDPAVSFSAVALRPGDGVYAVERSADAYWHWSGPEAEFQIENPLDEDRVVEFTTGIRTGDLEEASVVVRWDGAEEELRVGSTMREYRAIITVPSGGTVIRFVTDASRVDAPGDSRVLFMRFDNPAVAVVE